MELPKAIVILQLLLGADLMLNSSKEFSFLKVISNLAVFQWLLWPAIYFSDLNPGQVLEITFMQVSEEEYFAFVWPGTICLILGLSAINLRQIDFSASLQQIRFNPSTQRYLQLAIFGLLFQFMAPLVPISLRFVFKVLSYLSYVGIAGLILSDHKTTKAKTTLIILILISILGAFRNAMFGEIVYFALLMSLLYFMAYKTSNYLKITFFSILVFTGLFIQLIKMPLRALNEQGETNLLENLKTINRAGHISIDKLKSDAFMGYSIARFNNGAVISFVMDRVPSKIEYANGNTVTSAILGSFIPRIVWPTKETSGTAMYLKYTGLKFEGASYGISQLGEAYANFGKRNGIIYMFFMGLTLAFFAKKILKKCRENPILILYLPILFLHTVKVESELNRSLGFMLRVIVVLSLINFILKTLSSKKYSLF